MKNGKALGILCFVVAIITLGVGFFHLLGKDFLWGGANVAAAAVFVILGIRSITRECGINLTQALETILALEINVVSMEYR